MSARATLATTARILRQLRRDHRTVALLLVVPTMLMVLMRYVFDAQPQTFQRVGVPLIGIFPLVSMFLVTSIAMLRERTSGTLERLMSMPLSKIDILLGYGLAFGVMAIVQSCIVSVIAIDVLGVHVAGPVPMVVALAVANALLGMALGLLLSAFAATEFQAIQFLPAFLLPQLLLCGLLVPRDLMAAPLRWLAHIVPMSYAYDGLRHVATEPGVSGQLLVDLAITGALAFACVVGGAATLRRRTP